MPMTKKQRKQTAKISDKSVIKASDTTGLPTDISIDCELNIAFTKENVAVEASADGTEIVAVIDPLPTYSGPAYHGDDIYQAGFPHPIVVNLATAKIAKNPQQMLKDHDPSKPIGHHTPVITATEMRLEGGVLSVPNSHRDEVSAGAKNGFPWQASIRGRMGNLTLLKAGQSRQINGRTVVGPRFIADNFLWRETTATGLGANESGPELSIVASIANGEDIMGFTAFVKACGLEVADLKEDQKEVLMAAWKAKFPENALEASGETGVGLEASGAGASSAVELAASAALARIAAQTKTFTDQMEASAKAVEDRIAASQAKELKAAQQRADIAEVFAGSYADLQASALQNGWDKEMMTVQKKLRDYETKPPRMDIFASGGTGTELPSHEIVAAALAITGGVTPDELKASGVDQKVIDAAESKQWRGIGYHALVRMGLQAAGKSVHGNISPTQYGVYAAELQAKYEYMVNSGMLEASTGYTVMNLASITDDAINRSINARYNAFASIIPKCAKQISARDFRPLNNYQLSSGGFLKKLADSGELEHLKFSDAKFTMEVDTQGAMIGVGRKYIVNDDVGIVSQFGEALGYKGAQTLERDFHLMILTLSFWRTAVGAANQPINYITGAGSAFGYAAMKASHHLWSNMQDREGNPINVGPATLLVQSGNMALDAKDLNKSEKRMVRNDVTTDITEANVFQGMLNSVAESQWLNHQSMGALRTSTGWFEFSDPMVQARFAVAYLDNQRVPKVETAPGSFNTLGQQMRVIFDYGMGEVSDMGAVFNKGAA